MKVREEKSLSGNLAYKKIQKMFSSLFLEVFESNVTFLDSVLAQVAEACLLLYSFYVIGGPC